MSYKKKSQKQLQIGEQIKREIANIFLKNDIFKNEEIEIVIKEVDISPDLKNTKIFTSINNDHIEKSKLIDELNRSNYYFQQKIAKSLNLRIIPKIYFVLDRTMDNAHKISNLITKESGVDAASSDKL